MNTVNRGLRPSRRIITWVMTFTMLLGVMLLLSLPSIVTGSGTALGPWVVNNGPPDPSIDPIGGNIYWSVESNVTQDPITVTGDVIFAINSGCTLTMTVDLGEAGIYVGTVKSITINEPGAPITQGGSRGAGIGGGSRAGGTITINGCTGIAYGGMRNAGISGGGNAGSTITITTDTFKATGSASGAGIG